MSEETGSNLPAVYDLMSTNPLQVWTSINTKSDEGKAALISLMQGEAAEAIGDALNTVVEVQDLLVHRVEIADTSTGELIEADRIVMVRPDGSAIACVSAGIRRSLQLITHVYGMAPWKPALSLKVTQKQTRAGRRTYILSPVPKVESKKK